MGSVKEHQEDVEISAQVGAQIVEAKARLAAHMREMGLTQERGWRIIEELRNTPTGHEFVFRPIHLQEETSLEVTVAIGPDGRPEQPPEL